MTLQSRLQVKANAEGCRLVYDAGVSVSAHLLGEARPLFCFRIWLAAGVSVVQRNCVGASVFATCNFSAQF